MGAKRAFFAVFCPQGEECDKLLLSTPYLHRQGAKELNDAMLTPIIHDKWVCRIILIMLHTHLGKDVSTFHKQVVQCNGLVNDTGVFSPCYSHRRNHNQLDAMCLVVHFTCYKGFYFIQEILFIGLRYGIFGTSEFHFTQIVCPVCFAFQQ